MAPTAIADLINHDHNANSRAHPDVLKTTDPHFVIEEHPIDEYEPIRAIVVGGGISGIIASILLPAKVPNLELVVYERNSDIGGVWHTNIYPGVRCDVPAHAYQTTFAPSTTWTEAYATGPEIFAYWKRIADQYEVHKYIRSSHAVTSAEWSEEKAKWIVKIQSDKGEFIDEANFLITATGHFSDPKLPDYPGIKDFKGHLRHTSNWDPNFNPRDKRIAVIGNGASGLQVLPQLQKVASRIDHYARNKTWVAAPIGGEDLADFVTDNIEDARTSPEKYLKFRKSLEAKLFSRFGGIFKDGPQNAAAEESIRKLMKARLSGSGELAEEIIPDFSVGCRRLTPGPGYLEALTADNVTYIRDHIAEFTETGIRTLDGTHREVDAVICSTGHDITFSTQFPVLCNGIDLQKAWRPGGKPGFPDTYLGMLAPGVPNFLTVLGPNATGPAGTLCHAVENQLTYVAKLLRKAATQGIRSMAPTVEATRDFRAYTEAFFPRTVMSESCSSWYNGGIKGGRIHGLWPGSAAHVDLVRKDPRWEDFSYTYNNPQGNRFGWLGNGWTKKDVAATNGEAPSDVDLTPWLEKEAFSGNVDLRSYHERWWIS
ncbi:4-hydroxyacetophenone monooxygenase [Colletotrichum camelliae]|nr:4-hydroxyacetophenone monooxygenase [Colletotrichum camelliae]